MNRLLNIRSLIPLLSAALLAVVVGCTLPTEKRPADAPVRVGVYVGPGARGLGMFRWLQIVDHAPQFEAVYLDGAAIRAGALDTVDVVAMPGGKSNVEARELGEEGQRALRRFIERGGGYVGTCAGAFLLMNRPPKDPNAPPKILAIAPYTHRSGSWGGEAMLQVSYTKEAARLSGITPGTRMERFNGGPVMIPTAPIPGADFSVMARFRSNLHSYCILTNAPSMGGGASAVAGTFGKGRVWLFAGHPEYYPRTWPSLEAAFKYVTGRQVTFSAPQRKRGQLAVGWWCAPGPGPAAAELARTLLRHDEIDLIPYSNNEIARTGMRHLDVFVVPDADETNVVNSALSRSGVLSTDVRAFLARGAHVVTWGRVARKMAPHANLIVVDSPVNVPRALLALKNAPAPAPRAAPPAKRAGATRAAVYFDTGAGGSGSIRWAALLALSPDFTFTPLSAEDVRRGALADIDLYVAPGGNSSSQAKTLEPAGCSNLVAFVRGGGRYFGSCAGCYLAMSYRPGEARAAGRTGMMPFHAQKCPYRGGAQLDIRFTKDAPLFGFKPGVQRTVRYHGGPVPLPSAPVPGADIRTVATYDCDGVYAYSTNTAPTMAGHPAILAGTLDKGRLVGISPHPESYRHTQDIIVGGLNYLTGGQVSTYAPQRTRGNLSVGFFSAHVKKDGAALAIDLMREATLDVRAIDATTIGQGDLEHCDVMVVSHPRKSDITRYVKRFLREGGTLVAFGSEKELATLPADLPNIVRCASAAEARRRLLAL